MKRFLILDFETRSKADIKKVGAWEYAVHPSTRVLCVAWKWAAFNDLLNTKTHVWKRHSGEPIPTHLLRAFADPETTIVAHNAGFERFITENVMPRHLPKGFAYTVQGIPIERWECTAAMAAAHALPRDLDGACTVLGLKHQKDKMGKLLIRRHCIPRKPTKGNPSIWNDDVEGLDALARYCADDVRAEAELFVTLPRLIPIERKVWALNQRINTRGVYVDRPLVKTALKLIAEETTNLNARALALTSGIRPTQRAQILAWCKRNGLALPNLQAKTVAGAIDGRLARGRVRELLVVRQALSKTSTAKYQAFEARTCSDGRLRDLQMYHGASTGREAGTGVQTQNFPRGTLERPDEAIGEILHGDLAWVRAIVGEPMAALSSCLRGCIRATPGHDFFCGDFNAIEARIVFWVADHHEGLKLFALGDAAPPERAREMEIYVDQAHVIYGTPHRDVTDDERFVGKQSILGCGFGMGDKKFQAQCKQFGQEVSAELAKRAVKSYRTRHAPVVALWGNLERAAIKAVQNPGKVYSINHTRWFVEGKFLYCELPSGRRLAYFGPSIKWKPTPWGEKRATLYHWSVNPKTKQWDESGTYGGKLTENVVQGIARDCMVLAQLRTERAKYIPLMSVHDELAAERKRGRGELKEFERLMAKVPLWAPGLPVKVKAWVGERYRK